MSLSVVDCTVASGAAANSSVLRVPSDAVVVGLQLSATFDGTTLTMKGNNNGSTTYSPVKDVYGSAVVLTIADDTANYYFLDPIITYGLTDIVVISDATQGIAETIRWSLRTKGV